MVIGLLAIIGSAGIALAEPAPIVTPAPHFDAALDAQRAHIAATLKPGVRAKLDPAIQEVLRRSQPVAPPAGKTPPPVDLAAVARSAVVTASLLQGGDPETLVTLVLAESAKNADGDLRAAVADLKSLNAKKAAQRAALRALKAARAKGKNVRAPLDGVLPTADFTKADFDAVKDVVIVLPDDKREDALADLSQETQLRIGVAEARRSKAQTMLSNILKRIADGKLSDNVK